MAESDTTPEALMSRYAHGDEKAFQALYECLADRVYGYCVRLLRRKTDAHDIFQETFVKLHRARGTYAHGSPVFPWVFAIARSVFLDHIRKQKRHPQEDVARAETIDGADAYPLLVSKGLTPEEQLRGKEFAARVVRVLESLPDSQREAFLLLKEEELSVQEAAAVLGVSAMAVKLRAHRAYEALREALADTIDDARGR